LVDEIVDELVRPVGIDRLNLPRQGLAVGGRKRLVIGDRGVVERHVSTPDLVAVYFAFGLLHRGQMRPSCGDHLVQRGLDGGVVVVHH
jgi:hypothetical protein